MAKIFYPPCFLVTDTSSANALLPQTVALKSYENVVSSPDLLPKSWCLARQLVWWDDKDHVGIQAWFAMWPVPNIYQRHWGTAPTTWFYQISNSEHIYHISANCKYSNNSKKIDDVHTTCAYSRNLTKLQFTQLHVNTLLPCEMSSSEASVKRYSKSCHCRHSLYGWCLAFSCKSEE